MADTDTDKATTQANKKKVIARIQVVGLIALLFALMTTSVVTALMATGIIDISPATSGPANSMTDAKLICDGELQQEYGNKLQAYAMDDLSSRSGGKGGGYRLYYEITMYRDSGRKTGVDKYYVNCFVTATGRIRQFELFQEKTYVPKAGRRTKGNAFGL